MWYHIPMENSNVKKLNSAQILPVKDTEGAVLVIAGAGSGKTRVLTHRIAYLVNELNVNPSNILAITFTNKAADEMKARLYSMVDNLEGMWVSTIHSMCVKILRSAITSIGFDKNFSIYSEDDKDRVLKRIIIEMNLEPEKFLKLAKNLISSAKNDDLSPREFKEEYLNHPNTSIIAEIYLRYQQELKKANALDFDDLLIKTLELLSSDDEVREYYAHKFKYVHIDEFQDTNTVQFKIAKLLCSHHHNIFVVGDDDQSIYGWRGAKISNILNFEKHFLGAKIYKLEQNYRSTKAILNAANLIIKNNRLRKSKSLWTENDNGEKIECYVGYEEVEEASYVATKIKSLINGGKSASDFAILMRVNALSRSFEQELLKYNIPYKVYGGFKFFDRKEIKDLTAYLRIISNPLDNEAILRVINVPRRGIGDKTIEVLRDYAKNYELSIYDALLNVEELALSSSAINRLKSFKNLLYNFILKSSTVGLVDLVKQVVEETNFLSQFEEDTEENIDKRMNISELISSVEEFSKLNENATLTDYLGSITLSSDTDEMNEGNFVTVATIHAVKGLEFDTVFVVGLEETIFPISRAVSNPDELEEERRLMYVAITRAEKRLYITRSKSRYLYGNRTISAESRFVKEIAPLLERKGETPISSGLYQNERRSVERDYGYYSDEPLPQRTFGATKSFTAGFKSNSANKINLNSGANSKYKSGMKVKHAKFGLGTVITVKNEGKIVDVAFEGVGIKSLASEIAPLEIL